MTENLRAARTHAEIAALTSTLKGQALTAELDAAGLGHLRSATVAMKREQLGWLYGARLNSQALSRR